MYTAAARERMAYNACAHPRPKGQRTGAVGAPVCSSTGREQRNGLNTGAADGRGHLGGDGRAGKPWVVASPASQPWHDRYVSSILRSRDLARSAESTFPFCSYSRSASSICPAASRCRLPQPKNVDVQ
jgi:hypothetical protein